jgi:hypothetical protein
MQRPIGAYVFASGSLFHMTIAKDQDQYPDNEARQRFEAAIRVALSGPAKPHSEMKLGKPRGKRTLGKVATKPTKAKRSK